MAGERAAEPPGPEVPGARSVEQELVAPDRLNTLADGVFAIVMTLLVFKLGVPAAQSGKELSQLLGDMWPEFLMYALSFMVLGIFWLVHHMIFSVIVRSDSTLVWLNIVFLMFAALIPFSTALIGEHGATTITALFYGSNMLALFFMGWATWTYVTSGRSNLASDLDEAAVRGVKTMGLVYFAAFTVPLALAFISPIVSMIIYGLIVLVFIGFTVLGRGEAIVVWPPRFTAS